MTQLREFPDVRVSARIIDAYGDLLQVVDGFELEETVGRAVQTLTVVDRFYLFRQFPDLSSAPMIIAARYEDEIESQVGKWDRRYRFVDPFNMPSMPLTRLAQRLF